MSAQCAFSGLILSHQGARIESAQLDGAPISHEDELRRERLRVRSDEVALSHSLPLRPRMRLFLRSPWGTHSLEVSPSASGSSLKRHVEVRVTLSPDVPVVVQHTLCTASCPFSLRSPRACHVLRCLPLALGAARRAGGRAGAELRWAGAARGGPSRARPPRLLQRRDSDPRLACARCVPAPRACFVWRLRFAGPGCQL